MKSYKNIILIGFMGSGKTSVGKKLSMKLKREFIDMDDFLEKREKMSITDMFATIGEAGFRALEADLCKRFDAPKDKIIATGGGVIKSPSNMANLKKGGVVIYLKSTPAAIAFNLQYDNTRPLLQVEDKEAKIAELMEQREPLYKKYADITIDVSELELDDTVDLIIKKLK